MSSVAQRVKKIIAENLDVDLAEVTDNARVAHSPQGDDLGADSLDVIGLIVAFEKEFAISIPDEDAEHLWTVGEIVNLIQAKLKDPNVRAPGVLAKEYKQASFSLYIDKEHIASQDVNCADCSYYCTQGESCRKGDDYKNQLQVKYPSYDVNISMQHKGHWVYIEGQLAFREKNLLPQIMASVFESKVKG